VIEVRHVRNEGGGWLYFSATTATIAGGGRTLDESKDAAEHAVRHFLSETERRDVPQEEARIRTRHVQAPGAGRG
jgi:hypothetical protein